MNAQNAANECGPVPESRKHVCYDVLAKQPAISRFLAKCLQLGQKKKGWFKPARIVFAKGH